MLRAALISCGLVLAAPLAQAADRMTVVVERGAETVEVFFGLPAEGMVEVFGLDPALLVDETGEVAFEPLRLGTWEIGDALFSTVEARIDGAPVAYEAMSLMVHPEDAKLPLYDGYDGLVAIAVCSVDPPENPTLEVLYSYVGLIAYPEDTSAPMSFRLPNTDREMIEVEIRDFRQGELLSETVVSLEDGGVITLDAAPQEPRLAGLQLWALVAGIGAAGLATWAASWVRRTRAA